MALRKGLEALGIWFRLAPRIFLISSKCGPPQHQASYILALCNVPARPLSPSPCLQGAQQMPAVE